MAELVISGFIDDQLLRARRRWSDIVDIYFVRLQFVLQKVVPLEDPVLVAVHEAGAGLYIEPRVLFLDGLKLACGVDDDVPASRLLTNRVVVFLQAVDAKGDRHVQSRTFVQDACDVGNDPLPDLAVRQQVDRFQLVVLVESSRDFGKVLSRNRFAARNDQHAEIGAERFADARHLRRGHLEFLARFVVQFVREEAMNAAHIADGSNEDIQKDWRKRAAGRHPRVPLQNFFVMEIHAARSEQYIRFTGCWRPARLLERSSLVWYARSSFAFFEGGFLNNPPR